MNKLLLFIFFCGTIINYTNSGYNGGTLAPVILAGSVVKHSGTEVTKKYKRKDCPVCKGKGWYISGDDIQKVPCGYCEPESSDQNVTQSPINKCNNSNCKCKNCKCKNCGCVPSVE